MGLGRHAADPGERLAEQRSDRLDTRGSRRGVRAVAVGVARRLELAGHGEVAEGLAVQEAIQEIARADQLLVAVSRRKALARLADAGPVRRRPANAGVVEARVLL